MSWIGSVPAGQFQVTAGADPNDIPKNSDDPLEIKGTLDSHVTAIQVVSNVAEAMYLYSGPNSNLSVLMIIPGYTGAIINLERQPLALSQNARLSIGAVGTSDITSGEVIINLWA